MGMSHTVRGLVGIAATGMNAGVVTADVRKLRHRFLTLCQVAIALGMIGKQVHWCIAHHALD